MAGQARGYSWPPFEQGNEAAISHGGWSERRIAPLAEALMAELPARAPWCARGTFSATVAAWARTEARVALVAAWLADVGDLDADGTPRPATGLLERLERRAASLRAELGLTPIALAHLLRVMGDVVARGHGEVAAPDGALDHLARVGRAVLDAVDHPTGNDETAESGGRDDDR